LKQLLGRAAKMGYAVHVWDLGPRLAGITDIQEQSITLNLDLTHAERRSALAHELGHAHYGHSHSTPRAERQARAYAAALLIDPREYSTLERINADQHWLAEEFTVTPRIIFDYEALCLTRLRGVTYVRPRLGIGQWAHRLEHA